MTNNPLPLRTRLLPLLVGMALLATSCGQLAADSSAVAAVGDRTLSDEQLQAIVDPTGEANTIPTATAAGAISEWLFWELWIAEIEDRGLPLTDDIVAFGREQLAEAAAGGTDIPDADSTYGQIISRYQSVSHLVATYLVEFEGVLPPSTMCSSHILLESEEEAQVAIDRFNEGEAFAALAAELSTGPSGPGGGGLGCVDPASFVAEFVAGAAAVDPPGISVPVQSEFGWHVIFVDSFGPPSAAEMAAMSATGFDELILESGGEKVAELQASLSDRSVEVDSRFGEWDSATLRIIPPGSAPG